MAQERPARVTVGRQAGSGRTVAAAVAQAFAVRAAANRHDGPRTPPEPPHAHPRDVPHDAQPADSGLPPQRAAHDEPPPVSEAAVSEAAVSDEAVSDEAVSDAAGSEAAVDATPVDGTPVDAATRADSTPVETTPAHDAHTEHADDAHPDDAAPPLAVAPLPALPQQPVSRTNGDGPDTAPSGDAEPPAATEPPGQVAQPAAVPPVSGLWATGWTTAAGDAVVPPPRLEHDPAEWSDADDAPRPETSGAAPAEADGAGPREPGEAERSEAHVPESVNGVLPVDARDRLLAVLLDDPECAVGAAEELETCLRELERLSDAVRQERASLRGVLRRLAAAGLRPEQLARLARMPLAEVEQLLVGAPVQQA